MSRWIKHVLWDKQTQKWAIFSCAVNAAIIGNSADLKWPAQVSTYAAGGRLPGSSLIRCFILPDYVPYVRVHWNEQTNTRYIAHIPTSSPCFSHLVSDLSQKNINGEILTSATKWTPASSGLKHNSQHAVRIRGKGRLGLGEMVVRRELSAVWTQSVCLTGAVWPVGSEDIF